jgi:hypothetical protein
MTWAWVCVRVCACVQVGMEREKLLLAIGSEYNESKLRSLYKLFERKAEVRSPSVGLPPPAADAGSMAGCISYASSQ